MGRVLKRFLKEHAAYAAAGVAATARGIGEAASGEESEDQSFYVAMMLLFALAFIGACIAARAADAGTRLETNTRPRPSAGSCR